MYLPIKFSKLVIIVHILTPWRLHPTASSQANNHDLLLYEKYFDGGEHTCTALFNKLVEPLIPIGSVEYQNRDTEQDTQVPPFAIPPAYIDKYTFHNIVPNQTYYFNDGHGDYSSHWTVDTINAFTENKVGCYNLTVCEQMLLKYPHIVSGKVGLVIGSETPWAEAMLINKNASHITTVEYADIVNEHPQISVIKPSVWAAQAMSKPHAPVFDFCFTFSSIEHDGLGRYGDPINPFADYETVRRIRCQLKEGGILFLGIPCGPDTIRWNADRVYGLIRLSILLKGWTILDVIGESEPLTGEAHAEQEKHLIWVLQKTDSGCNGNGNSEADSGHTCSAADHDHGSSYLESYFRQMEDLQGGELVEHSRSLSTAYRLYELPIGVGLQPFIFMGRHAEAVGLMSDLCAKKCVSESVRRAFPGDSEASLCLMALRHYSLAGAADGRNASLLWPSLDHFILRLSMPDAAIQHRIRDIRLNFQEEVNLTVTRGDTISVAVILQRCERFCLYYTVTMPGCTLLICLHVVYICLFVCMYICMKAKERNGLLLGENGGGSARERAVLIGEQVARNGLRPALTRPDDVDALVSIWFLLSGIPGKICKVRAPGITDV